MGLAVLSHDEKRSRHIFLLEYIENSRRIFRIWSIVKSQRDVSGMISGALNHVSRWDLVVVVRLRTDKSGIRIDGEATLPVVRARNYLQQLSGAFKVDVVSIRHFLEGVGGRTGLVCAEHRPDRRVFRTKSPHRESRRMITTGGAHLIERRDRVEKPDDV